MVNKKLKIHFVGIKGVGLAPLAITAKEAGYVISGCDVAEEFITDIPLRNAGIVPLPGFAPNHVDGIDLVITTSAHGGLDNPEVKYAKKQGIRVLTHGEALAQFQSGEIFGRKFEGISISGSHGKTTTTAMLATVLLENKKDPSFAVGTGSVPSLTSCGHFGRGKYFIAEADEYVNDPVYDKRPKFLLQNPKIVIVTNIDFDHPDIFKDVSEIEKIFLSFVNKLDSKNGVLIVCGDGDYNKKFAKKYLGRKITYGVSIDNDYVVERINISGERMFFWVKKDKVLLGEFVLQVFGEQNALNATAVIAACLEIGMPIEQIKKGLSQFMGTKRRSEFVGKLTTGALVYDDYAHHPTEISKTLQSFKKAFPDKKLVCIFQPHMYSRTKALLPEFKRAFTNSDEIIISEIFPSYREEIDPNFSSREISEGINKFGEKSTFIPTLRGVVEYVNQKKYSKNYLLVTMGAGDIYKVAQTLVGV